MLRTPQVSNGSNERVRSFSVTMPIVESDALFRIEIIPRPRSAIDNEQALRSSAVSISTTLADMVKTLSSPIHPINENYRYMAPSANAETSSIVNDVKAGPSIDSSSDPNKITLHLPSRILKNLKSKEIILENSEIQEKKDTEREKDAHPFNDSATILREFDLMSIDFNSKATKILPTIPLPQKEISVDIRANLEREDNQDIAFISTINQAENKFLKPSCVSFAEKSSSQYASLKTQNFPQEDITEKVLPIRNPETPDNSYKTKRAKVACEILETERVYMENMLILQEVNCLIFKNY